MCYEYARERGVELLGSPLLVCVYRVLESSGVWGVPREESGWGDK